MNSLSRNGEQVRNPSLISLLLSGCRGVRTYVFDIGTYGYSTARMYRCSMVCTYGRSTVHMYGCSMNTGILIYRYGRPTFLLRAY